MRVRSLLPRRMRSCVSRPMTDSSRRFNRSSVERTGFSPKLKITSPDLRPAMSAGLFGETLSTWAPPPAR